MTYYPSHITTPNGIWFTPSNYRSYGVEEGDLESIASKAMRLIVPHPHHFTTISFPDQIVNNDRMFKLVEDGRARMIQHSDHTWTNSLKRPFHFCVIESSESGHKPHIHFLSWFTENIQSVELNTYYKDKNITCSIHSDSLTHDNAINRVSYMFKTYSNPRWERRWKIIGVKPHNFWRYLHGNEHVLSEASL
jgi:hypothetical protein